MYICPICEKEYISEDDMRKHLLKCWRETHPNHKSKNAPHSEDRTTREVNDEMTDFFSSLQKRDEK